MNVDVDASTLTLAGVTFPACSLECPPVNADKPDSLYDRTLGGYHAPSQRWDLYVPAENGAFIQLDDTQTRRGVHVLEIYVFTSHCERGPAPDRLWLPTLMGVDGRVIRKGGKHWVWYTNDEEWAAEHVQRLARLHVVPCNKRNPRVTPHKLSTPILKPVRYCT